MQRIAILGSTGSIGTQTLEVARSKKDHLSIVGLTANGNWKLLAEQIKEFQPKWAVLGDQTFEKKLREAVSNTPTKLFTGSEALQYLMREPDTDVIVNSLVGFSGFLPTMEALKSGKRVALANKETLVVGGELLRNWLGFEKHFIFPIDSEHSAIQQCLVGESEDNIEKIIITASGGPFRESSREDLEKVTVDSALRHPNWSMGAKITIDSSTLMNKGLEVIEAFWLFGLPLEKISAVIHPQSIIHSMVTFCDGSTKAQLGYPDMKVPIQYALSYPDRWTLDTPRMNWGNMQQWTFEPIDTHKFPCFRLALESIEAGGYAPAVLNASNEVAVTRFLNREIPYIGIPEIVEKSLEHITGKGNISVSGLVEIDEETRRFSKILTI